jgi:hypothetical protein
MVSNPGETVSSLSIQFKKKMTANAVIFPVCQRTPVFPNENMGSLTD